MPIGLPRMGQMGGRSTPMSELNQAIALLRSVGGRMYLPGLTSRVASDGSGAVPVAGDVIGFLPDRVTGLTANAATQATTAAKPKLIREPILGPELVVNGDFSNGTTGWVANQASISVVNGELVVTATGSAYPQAAQQIATTVGKTYRLRGSGRNGTSTAGRFTDSNGALSVSANLSATMAAYTVDAVATGSNCLLSARVANTAVVGQTAIFDNISVREIIGYTERYSLEFDGVNDVLVGTAGPTLSDGLVMVWAGSPQRTEPKGGRYADLWATDGTLQEFGLTALSSNRFDARLRVVGYGEFNLPHLDEFQLGSDYIVTILITATTLNIRVNGGGWTSTEHGRTLTNVALVPGIGARPPSTLYSNATHNYFAYANLGANATDANIAILERAAAQAAGISL